MPKRLSLGLATFRKAIGEGTSSRAVFQAEYDLVTGTFMLSQALFIQRRSRISSVAKNDIACTSITDVLDRLAKAAVNAAAEGFKFDVGALKLLAIPDGLDETWTEGMRPCTRASSLKVKAKPKSKH